MVEMCIYLLLKGVIIVKTIKLLLKVTIYAFKVVHYFGNSNKFLAIISSFLNCAFDFNFFNFFVNKITL